jgi:hypothetical protein
MTTEMDLRINNAGDEITPLKVDNVLCLGRRVTLPHGDDLFLFHRDETIHDLSLSHNLSVFQENIDLRHFHPHSAELLIVIPSPGRRKYPALSGGSAKLRHATLSIE